MAEIYKRKILKHVAHRDYEPIVLSKFAKLLGVEPDNYPAFEQDFDELRRAGRVVIGSGNVVTLPALANQLVGTFRQNPRGFGFVVPLESNTHGDLFIPPHATADAMTGDIVRTQVIKERRRTGEMGFVGKITEVIERSQSKFVGTLLKQEDNWVVRPDGKEFIDPIAVDDVRAKDAKKNNKVVVEIIAWPTERYLARGVITEVLGKAGCYDAEIASVIRHYHLPTEFDNNCLNQARTAARQFKPEKASHRRDITDKTVITIDPEKSKDFDDAISLERDRDGNFVLGVHIADVSYFVKPDTPLDKEAGERGNSVYLPARTIPMLPEILSNGVCSLQPDQPRFAKSVYITYDSEANILDRNFENSVISSTQRLTYRQADAVLGKKTKGIKPQVVDLLRDMEELSRSIEARRRKQGMIHLDLPETEVVMDDSGRVVDVQPADQSYPHTIIEMFMVEANDAVASLFDRLDIPLMRRIHPDPDKLTLANLSKGVKAFGLNLPRNPSKAAIQKLLNHVRELDSSLAVNLLVLRSFEKAQYSPLEIGHYALASEHYCHFTSPIRRYADLLVHRALDCYLTDKLKSPPKGWLLPRQSLEEIGRHIAFTEERSEDAEDDLRTVLTLQLLRQHIGRQLKCVVTGVTGFGIFAQSKKYGLEGLIRLEDLGSDDWQYSQKTQSIVGKRSGTQIRLGQGIKTKIAAVNIAARELDLVPATPLTKPESSESKNSKKAKKSPKPSKGKKKKKRK